METESEWNEKIMAITLQIQQQSPELMKFLGEMPVTIPDQKKPAINIAALKDYYESLQDLLKKYQMEQSINKTE